MQGEKIGEESGKVTSQRVLPNLEGGPKMETSFQASSTLLGAKATNRGTYWSVVRPSGTLYGEGQGIVMVEAEACVRAAHGPKGVGLAQHRRKWVVLFFYPRDVKFICPTETASVGAIQKDFEREHGVGIRVIADSFCTHNAWLESDPRLAN